MLCSLLHYLVRPLEIGSARRTFGKEEEEEEAKGDFLFVTSSIHSPPSLLRLRNINLGKQGKGGGKVGRKGHAQRIALPLVPYLPGDVVGLFIRHSEDITSLSGTSVSSSKFTQPLQKTPLYITTRIADISLQLPSVVRTVNTGKRGLRPKLAEGEKQLGFDKVRVARYRAASWSLKQRRTILALSISRGNFRANFVSSAPSLSNCSDACSLARPFSFNPFSFSHHPIANVCHGLLNFEC